MLNNIFILIVALFLVIKAATLATRYAAVLAESFQLSKYTVGFIIIAVISILPESFIAIQAAINGVPDFGLGMLFGSNIADLTLIFAILVFAAGRSLQVEGKILKSHAAYPFILMLPLILGMNGHLSRLEGLALIIAGGVFYYLALRDGTDSTVPPPPVERNSRIKNSVFLLLSMGLLFIGSHFIVSSATALAAQFGVSPIIIGMLIVGLGTTMPELFFSLNAVKRHDDSLAVGDLLGTVLADATIVVGLLAIISPFSFPREIVFVTGTFMIMSSFLLFYFMESGRRITKKEAKLLVFFWITFVLVTFFAGR
jgi:cation:H+ antiporter